MIINNAGVITDVNWRYMFLVSDICELPKDPGPCQAYTNRWYLDMNTKTCSEFRFGGCQGNPNNFKSKKECEEFCGSKMDNGTGVMLGKSFSHDILHIYQLWVYYDSELTGHQQGPPILSYKLRYIVGLKLVENVLPTLRYYRNLYENTGPGGQTS